MALRSDPATAGGHRRHLLSIVLVVAVVLAACDPPPPPPPDGRDLGIEIVDAPAHVAPGETATVSALVTSHGAVTATGARIGAFAPANLTVTSITGPAVSGCATFGGIVTCGLGDLGPGATAMVELTVVGGTAGATQLLLLTGSDGSDPPDGPHPNVLAVPLTVGTGATVDLRAQGELPTQGAGVGATFTARTWVTNLGPSAAADVQVTQTAPDGFSIGDARLVRALPGGSTASGSCTVVVPVVTCDTDGALVEPTTVPAERWVLEVDLTGTAAGAFQVTHSVSSPHPEPDPDPHPNTSTTDGFLVDGGILFEPVDPVPVGATFDLHGVAYNPSFIVGYFIGLTLPDFVEIESVTASGTVACEPRACPGPHITLGVTKGTPVSVRLRAIAPGGPAPFHISFSDLSFGVGGGTTVEVFDPSIGSDVHPHFEASLSGIVGQPQTITGAIRNGGATDHPQVTATLSVPASFQVDAATWGVAELPCAVAGPVVTCEVGTVAAHSTVAITLDVTPLTAGTSQVVVEVTSTEPQDSPDPFPDSQVITVELSDTAVDLGLTVSTSHDPAVEGVSWLFRVMVRNHGNVPATGVAVVIDLPEGVAVQEARFPAPIPPAATGCTIDGQQATCGLTELAPQRSATIWVTGLVAAGTTGTATAVATSDQVEPNSDAHPNEVTHEVTVVAPHGDVRVSFGSLANTIFAGQPRDVVVVVSNEGPSRATGVSSSMVVPEGWAIQAAALTTGSACAVEERTATCQFSPINSGDSRSYRVTVVPDEPSAASTMVATVTPTLPDPNPANNQTSRTVVVVDPVADLGLTASYTPTVGVGSVGPVTLNVRNQGPAPASNVVLTTTLPPSVLIDDVADLGGGFGCDIVGQTVTCTHPLLPTGVSSVRLWLLYDVPDPAVSFTATVASSVPEGPDTFPNSVTITRAAVEVPATIEGTVRDHNNVPVQSGEARLYRVGQATHSRTVSISGGIYRFTNVAPGDYHVQVLPGQFTGLQSEWYDDQPLRDGATAFTAANRSELHIANFVVHPIELTVITGTVVDEDGNPVAGATVRAYRDTDGVAASHVTTTSTTGEYALVVGSAGYRVSFTPPAGSGLRNEWFDDQPTRGLATPLLAYAWGQVIVADAELAPLAPP